MKHTALAILAATAVNALPLDVAALMRRHAGFNENDIGAVRRGERVVRPIGNVHRGEVAFAGATRLPISITAYLDRLRAGTLYRTGENIIGIGRFSETPTPADLNRLPGSDTNRADLIERIRAYETTGLTSTCLEDSGYVRERIPAAIPWFRDYPRVASRGPDDFFLWTQLTFGLRPLTRLAHVAIWERKEEAFVITKQIYASRYFDASYQLDHLVRDGSGIFLISLNYGRSELLAGMAGKLVRPLVVSRTVAIAERTLDQARRDLQHHD